jgi:hypothetical protein
MRPKLAAVMIANFRVEEIVKMIVLAEIGQQRMIEQLW